jgi:hypothetical protein
MNKSFTRSGRFCFFVIIVVDEIIFGIVVEYLIIRRFLSFGDERFIGDKRIVVLVVILLLIEMRNDREKRKENGTLIDWRERTNEKKNFFFLFSSLFLTVHN